jgi:hypothetical protein
MGISQDEILKKLLVNYDNATKLLPEEFKEEFQKRIIRREELKAFASLISKTVEFQIDQEKSFTQDQIRARFSLKGFGRRLMLKGIRLEQVYAELVMGLFE